MDRTKNQAAYDLAKNLLMSKWRVANRAHPIMVAKGFLPHEAAVAIGKVNAGKERPRR